MNLVEEYMQELISVVPYTNEWTHEFKDRTFVKVKALWNCYGRIEEREEILNNWDWEKLQEKGYRLV